MILKFQNLELYTENFKRPNIIAQTTVLFRQSWKWVYWKALIRVGLLDLGWVILGYICWLFSNGDHCEIRKNWEAAFD